MSHAAEVNTQSPGLTERARTGPVSLPCPRAVPWGDVLVRPTQWYRRNSHPYGPIVRAAVVTRLTSYTFREVYHPDWILSLSTVAEADETPSPAVQTGVGCRYRWRGPASPSDADDANLPGV